jgi:hypothetical protein
MEDQVYSKLKNNNFLNIPTSEPSSPTNTEPNPEK